MSLAILFLMVAFAQVQNDDAQRFKYDRMEYGSLDGLFPEKPLKANVYVDIPEYNMDLLVLRRMMVDIFSEIESTIDCEIYVRTIFMETQFDMYTKYYNVLNMTEAFFNAMQISTSLTELRQHLLDLRRRFVVVHQKETTWPDIRVKIERVPISPGETFDQWVAKVKSQTAAALSNKSIEIRVAFSSIDELPYYVHVQSIQDEDGGSSLDEPTYPHNITFSAVASVFVEKMEKLLRTCVCHQWISIEEGKCYFVTTPAVMSCETDDCGQYYRCGNRSVESQYERYCVKDYAWERCDSVDVCEQECKLQPNKTDSCNATCGGHQGHQLVAYQNNFPHVCCLDYFVPPLEFAVLNCTSDPCVYDYEKLVIGVSVFLFSLVLLVIIPVLVYLCYVQKVRRRRLLSLQEDKDFESKLVKAGPKHIHKLDGKKVPTKKAGAVASPFKSPIAKKSASPIASAKSKK